MTQHATHKKHGPTAGAGYYEVKDKRNASYMRKVFTVMPSTLHRLSALVVIAVVVLAGSYFIFSSGATSPFVTVQPEGGTVSAPAIKVPDTSASGGNAVRFAGPASGYTTVYDEQFNGTYTHAYANNGIYPNLKHPHLFVEWSGALPVSVSNGTGKITNNSISGSGAKGFHRMFSTERFGGPGTSLKITAKVRMTKLYDDGGWGGFRGVKLGMKFPTSGTGYSQEDPMSVKGGVYGSNSPGSMIFVTGVMEDGRTELARNGYGDIGYYDFKYGPKIPYTFGTWKDITIQTDWIPNSTQLRIRYWQNATGSGTPIFDWTDPNSPFQEAGFLWYRTDFSDFEYDYVRIEEYRF